MTPQDGRDCPGRQADLVLSATVLGPHREDQCLGPGRRLRGRPPQRPRTLHILGGTVTNRIGWERVTLCPAPAMAMRRVATWSIRVWRETNILGSYRAEGAPVRR